MAVVAMNRGQQDRAQPDKGSLVASVAMVVSIEAVVVAEPQV